MFEYISLDILLIMSIRFFLFDFYLFQPIWKRLDKLNNYFISHFLHCPFCQGFWTGFFYSLIFMPYGFFKCFAFGFITAFLNYVYYYLVYELFYNGEMLKMKHIEEDRNE